MIHECTIQSGCARPSALPDHRPQGAARVKTWSENETSQRSKSKLYHVHVSSSYYCAPKLYILQDEADGCSFSPSAVAEARSLIAFTTAFRISHTWNKSYSTRSVSYKHNSFKGF